MGQSRLSNLEILQIERDTSSTINKEDIIKKFSAAAEIRGWRLIL